MRNTIVTIELTESKKYVIVIDDDCLHRGLDRCFLNMNTFLKELFRIDDLTFKTLKEDRYPEIHPRNSQKIKEAILRFDDSLTKHLKGSVRIRLSLDNNHS